MEQLSKCEKLSVLKQKFSNLEQLTDTISTKKYKEQLRVLKRDLITLLLSKEQCKQDNDDMDNFYINLSDLENQIN